LLFVVEGLDTFRNCLLTGSFTDLIILVSMFGPI
jgi:hypothetical protein